MCCSAPSRVDAPGENLRQRGRWFAAYPDVAGEHTGGSCPQQRENGGAGKKWAPVKGGQNGLNGAVAAIDDE